MELLKNLFSMKNLYQGYCACLIKGDELVVFDNSLIKEIFD